SIWDTFSHTPGKTRNGDTGDTACDAYHRYPEDIALMQQLGLRAYRFSISWPRVLPTGAGAVNQVGLDYYSRLVDALLEAGITPFATLFHWDLPQSLEDKFGGFRHRDCAAYFADYAETVVKRLGDRVQHWITFNEPWVHAMLGYGLGIHAPGKRNPWAVARVSHHQLLAHGMAVERLRALSPGAQVGITLSMSPIHPRTDSEKDRQAARLTHQFTAGFFLDGLFKGRYPEPLWGKMRLFRPKIESGDMAKIARPIDFLGINNYSRDVVHYDWRVPFLKAKSQFSGVPEREFEKDGAQYTAMGWEVYPPGIYELLMMMKNEYNNPPVYITENGAAFSDTVENGRVHDTLRQTFFEQYLAQVSRAAAEGANVKGYFAWSLLDNFEWAEGYSKRFGIIYVDYASQKRIIKDSGLWYARRANGHH
ncbi:MAG: beta-glucosidase, partial [Anaerolineaceae bacterium 4572_5.2]